MRARPISTELPIRYRESILHPAMNDSLTTDGTFDLGRGGTLIRHQTAPIEEITEIGARFLKLTRTADGYENTVPIPERLAPFLTVMRAIVRGDGSALAGYHRRLNVDANGWSLHLTSSRQDPIELIGCGPTLSGITLTLGGGEQRLISFVPPP